MRFRRHQRGLIAYLAAAALILGACTLGACTPAPTGVGPSPLPPSAAPLAMPVTAPSPQPAVPIPPAEPAPVPATASPTALAPGETIATFADALPPGALEIAAGGDVTLGGVVGDLIAERGAAWPWQEVAPLLRRADVGYVNFEGTASLRGSPEEKTYTFRGDPAALPAMGAAGVTIASVANNHSLDFGPDALMDTVDGLAGAGILPVGGGADDAQAYKPAVVTRKGLRVAFVAATRVLPPGWAAGPTTPGVASAYDERRLLATAAAARAAADFVVVAVHWGSEGATVPDAQQVHLAHALIAAGAGLVLGGHPHVLQPVVRYRDGLIAYSLGNLVFTGHNLVQAGMILRVGVLPGGELVAARIPIRIVGGQPRPEQP